METGFGNPTQPQNLTISDPLTAQIESLQPHLYTGVGMMESPMPQRLNVRFAKGNLDHDNLG